MAAAEGAGAGAAGGAERSGSAISLVERTNSARSLSGVIRPFITMPLLEPSRHGNNGNGDDTRGFLEAPVGKQLPNYIDQAKYRGWHPHLICRWMGVGSTVLMGPT